MAQTFSIGKTRAGIPRGRSFVLRKRFDHRDGGFGLPGRYVSVLGQSGWSEKPQKLKAEQRENSIDTQEKLKILSALTLHEGRQTVTGRQTIFEQIKTRGCAFRGPCNI